jgi:hypothetical protein
MPEKSSAEQRWTDPQQTGLTHRQESILIVAFLVMFLLATLIVASTLI